MFGGGKGGRPREDPTLTTRGIREIKRQQKLEDKARKSREKEEKKRLWKEGKCVAPDGRVASLTQVGREHGGWEQQQVVRPGRRSHQRVRTRSKKQVNSPEYLVRLLNLLALS